MRALLQRVSQAAVHTNGREVARCGRGWLVLLGVGRDDDARVAEAMVEKIVGLRCFQDAEGKTNLAAGDVGAEFLVVSQFTLYADLSRGRRPGFSYAAPPDQAQPLVERFARALRDRGFSVGTGVFGAEMSVS